jgi:ribosomal protein S27AE
MPARPESVVPDRAPFCGRCGDVRFVDADHACDRQRLADGGSGGYCPHCGSRDVSAEYADVGPGSVQVAPFQCGACGSVQVDWRTDPATLTPAERECGWYRHPDLDRGPANPYEADPDDLAAIRARLLASMPVPPPKVVRRRNG